MDGLTYRKLPFINRLYMVLFVLMPIINQYKIGLLTFLQIYTLFGLVVWFLNAKKMIISKNVIIYIIYILVITLIGYLIAGTYSVSSVVLRMISFTLLTINFYTVFPKVANFTFIYKVYTAVIYIVVISLFFQYFLYAVGNQPTMLLIPGTTLNYNSGVNSSEFMNYTINRISTGYYYRPCSIFIEPGFQSMFCAPWLALKLFYDTGKKGKDIFIALVVTVSMILTTSSMGILIAIILWMIYVAKTFSQGNKRRIQTVFLMLPFLIIAVFYLYGETNVSTSIAIKMQSTQNLNNSSSLTWRLLRGFECFKQIGIFQKFFGCGYGDLTSYFDFIHLSTKYDANLVLIDYMNGISYMFCSIGIVGALQLLSIIISFFSKNKMKMETKMLLICLAIIMLTASVFDSDKYFLYIGLAICTTLNRDAVVMNEGRKKNGV